MNPMEQPLDENKPEEVIHDHSENTSSKETQPTVEPESQQADRNENPTTETIPIDSKENIVQNPEQISKEQSSESSKSSHDSSSDTNSSHSEDQHHDSPEVHEEEKKEIEKPTHTNPVEEEKDGGTLLEALLNPILTSQEPQNTEPVEANTTTNPPENIEMNSTLVEPGSQATESRAEFPEVNTQPTIQSQVSEPSRTVLTDANHENAQSQSLQQPSNILVQHDVQFQSPIPNRQNPLNQSITSGSFNTVLERTRKLLAFIKSDASDPESHRLLDSSATKEPAQLNSPPQNFRASATLFQSPRPGSTGESAFTSLDQTEVERVQRTLDRIKAQQNITATQFSASYIADSFLGGTGPFPGLNTSQVNIHHVHNKYSLSAEKSDGDEAYSLIMSQPKSLYEANKDKIQSLIDSIKSRNEGDLKQRELGTPYYQNVGHSTQFQFGPNFYLPNYYPSYVGALSYYTRGLELTKRVLQEHYNQSMILKPEESKMESTAQKTSGIIGREESQKKKDSQIHRSIDVTDQGQLQREKEKANQSELGPNEFNAIAAVALNVREQESQKPKRRQESEKQAGLVQETEHSDVKRSRQTPESDSKDKGHLKRSNVSESKKTPRLSGDQTHHASSQNAAPKQHLTPKRSEEDLYQKFNSRQVESQNVSPEVKTDREPFMNEKIYVSQDPRQDADENLGHDVGEADQRISRGDIVESYVPEEQYHQKGEETETARDNIYKLLQDEATKVIVANEHEKDETEIFTEIEKNLNKDFTPENEINRERVGSQEEGEETPSKAHTRGVRFDSAVIEKDEKKSTKKPPGQAANSKASGQFASPKGKTVGPGAKGAGSQPSNPFGNFSGKKSKVQEQPANIKGGAGKPESSQPVALKFVSNAPAKQGKAGAEPNLKDSSNPLAPKAKPQTQTKPTAPQEYKNPFATKPIPKPEINANKRK